MAVVEPIPEKVTDTKPAFRNILAAIDFRGHSELALRYAAKVAMQNHTALSVVHVFRSDWRYEILGSPPELNLEQRDVKQHLDEFVKGFGLQPSIKTFLITGTSVVPPVLAFAGKMGTDLLVIGTRGRTGFAKLTLGSVAEELLRVAPCPVLTIGPNVDASPVAAASGLRSILFATDFGKGSQGALPLVLKIAAAQNASLILLHMLAPMPVTSTNLPSFAPSTTAADELTEWENSNRKHGLQRLKEWLPRETGLQQEPRFVVGTDFLPEGILTAADQFCVDLIVMGANRGGSARLAAHVPWSAVHEVVCKARCPVLTIAG